MTTARQHARGGDLPPVVAEIHWRCLTPGCPERGTTTGGDRGADAKHVAATGHGTTSHLREWATG